MDIIFFLFFDIFIYLYNNSFDISYLYSTFVIGSSFSFFLSLHFFLPPFFSSFLPSSLLPFLPFFIPSSLLSFLPSFFLISLSFFLFYLSPSLSHSFFLASSILLSLLFFNLSFIHSCFFLSFHSSLLPSCVLTSFPSSLVSFLCLLSCHLSSLSSFFPPSFPLVIP
ncbi:hypothetical protein HPP92_027407 [Vanilla planifolia]|uniref:Uncharacterized protein n=1 Tax=Vanilla planifolia TaxID=51239 RepID=A0A835U644_VANPL|nr:hypothetical protein HPP92_027407 [Vanilla planifolia]KAG0449368.1 hypothetical protein HPP92_027408 [Vanilla planifolia]